MGNLGTFLWESGRWTKAEKLQLQVDGDKEDRLGPQHPDTLIAWPTWHLSSNQGRWTEAEKLEVQGDGDKEEVLGPEHPEP